MKNKPIPAIVLADPPENTVAYEGWPKHYTFGQFNIWFERSWFYRICYWPDGARRFIGILLLRRKEDDLDAR